MRIKKMVARRFDARYARRRELEALAARAQALEERLIEVQVDSARAADSMRHGMAEQSTKIHDLQLRLEGQRAKIDSGVQDVREARRLATEAAIALQFVMEQRLRDWQAIDVLNGQGR